jgi:hypothetical protein
MLPLPSWLKGAGTAPAAAKPQPSRETIIREVERHFEDREARVAIREKAVAVREARLNRAMRFTLSVLADNGGPETAEAFRKEYAEHTNT